MPGGDLATNSRRECSTAFFQMKTPSCVYSQQTMGPAALRILAQQTYEKRFNTPFTTSTGRVLEAAAASLGICRERTYDGEPSMMLEGICRTGRSSSRWRSLSQSVGTAGMLLLTSSILREGMEMLLTAYPSKISPRRSKPRWQRVSLDKALAGVEKTGRILTAALSGGVAINRSIRETIIETLKESGVVCLTNPRYSIRRRMHLLRTGCYGRDSGKGGTHMTSCELHEKWSDIELRIAYPFTAFIPICSTLRQTTKRRSIRQPSPTLWTRLKTCQTINAAQRGSYYIWMRLFTRMKRHARIWIRQSIPILL